MLERLYTIFIAPRQRDRDMRSREVVLNALLAGTLLVLASALLLMVFDYMVLGYTYLAGRTVGIAVAGAFIGFLYWLSRTGRFRISSALLISLYMLLATLVAYRWGIVTPTAVLLYGLVIVLSGILLGPNYSLYFAGGIPIVLASLQLAAEHELIHPDWAWLTEPPRLGDIFGPAFIFAVMALASWLFNYQMERSLRRTVRAERALTKQKNLLETTVEERTRQLQAAQLEKIQQMYRFAELGQLSTALLHDLANHLTSLTMDIQGLEGQTRSRALQRAKRSIHYIDDMVLRVRDQLHGRSNIRPFNLVTEIDAVVSMLNHKAAGSGVTLLWQPPSDKKLFRVRGEPIRFRQLMANLVSNAIDAYETPNPSSKNQKVEISLAVAETTLALTVADWGKGIPRRERGQLFAPFYSTKKTGMGMGLFIVKQIAEEHFLGSVQLDDSTKRTAFVITLPRAT
jgi:signal transduction histidine kinase